MREQLRWLLPVGACASLDIGLSNWALEYVTVSLYTMCKST
jgi:solute carrier family 35 protein C2